MSLSHRSAATIVANEHVKQVVNQNINIHNMKKTNKKNTIKYIVDITNSFDEKNVILAFTKAKLENNIVPTAEQLNTLFNVWEESIAECVIFTMFNNAHNAIALIDGGIVFGNVTEREPETVKKPNVFKRFWNWITRK